MTVRRTRQGAERGSERGAAFLIALGALALVSALAAAALSLTTGPATRAAAAVAQAEASRAAEGALHRLIAALAVEDIRRAAPLDGAVISSEFLGAKIDFAAQDSGGLVDLDAAGAATLARLLRLTGAGNRAEEIAALWVGARASANESRGGFASPEAAIAVLPAELQAAARPALAHASVRSGRAEVDPWTASAPALAAAADLPMEEAQLFVARRALEGFAAPPPEPRADGAFAFSDRRVLRLTVRAETPSGGRAALTAMVRFSDSPRAPAVILSWR